jgi:hypothetical protein
MSLKLVRRAGSGNWYLRGSVRGVPVFESTGTDSKKAAEEIRTRREAEVLDASIHGKRAVGTFMQAAVIYLEAGGSPRFVGSYDEAAGKWDGLIGHFGTTKLSNIGQIELDAAARVLYPKASPETRNRQVYTPFIAIWKKAETRGLCEVRRWERPRMNAKPRDRWATQEEVAAMVAAAPPPRRRDRARRLRPALFGKGPRHALRELVPQGRRPRRRDAPRPAQKHGQGPGRIRRDHQGDHGHPRPHRHRTRRPLQPRGRAKGDGPQRHAQADAGRNEDGEVGKENGNET